MVTSYTPDSGRVVFDRQRLGTLGQYVVSPIAADGRIYAASETGTIVVFRASDTLEVLARNDLGESIMATPAIADHKLYVRTAKHLWHSDPTDASNGTRSCSQRTLTLWSLSQWTPRYLATCR